MDLGTIKTLLADFSTFAKHTSELFQNLPAFLKTVGPWFVETDGKLGVVKEAETTSSLLGSSAK